MAGPKVLAQHGGTGTMTSIYTSPVNGGGTVISSIVFAGTIGATTGTAEVRIAPAGASDAAVHVVVPAFTIKAGDHLALTEGLTLSKTDVVRVSAGAGLNVHLYGTEL